MNENFAIVQGGVVVNIAAADADFAASVGWVPTGEAGIAIGWLWDGAQFSPPEPPPRQPEELQAEIVAATQARLDTFARTRSYDGILSACTYATSTVPRFQAEGQYCVEARDATWARLYEMLAEVRAGTRPVPNGFSDVEPGLPALTWPTLET